MGIPYYQSFDYYTVLVSLLTNPAFYYTFFATDTLQQIFWDPVFGTAGPSMMAKIKDHVMAGTGSSINDALTMLKHTKLKCGAVPQVISKLQAYHSSN